MEIKCKIKSYRVSLFKLRLYLNLILFLKLLFKMQLNKICVGGDSKSFKVACKIDRDRLNEI